MSLGGHHERLRVAPTTPYELKSSDPKATYGFNHRTQAEHTLRRDIERLLALQDRFNAAKSHGVVLILQGMDASGKDGVVKHVMSGMNPAGVHVYAFGEPSKEELAHDFLWRTTRVLPERGRIAVFNRSHYRRPGYGHRDDRAGSGRAFST
ncbi:MAG: polyphosphate kinase 2 family protein [Candidatus Tyrphobacter sp.]